MDIIIEADGVRRPIKKGFLIYGSDADLKIIQDSIQHARSAGLVLGWVDVGESSVKDKTFLPFDAARSVLPTHPFAIKP